jgi:dihydrolipoamide dehydrogenase
MTEEQARQAGLDVVVDTVDFRGIGKANMLREGGLVRLVAEVDGPVRGVHMIGPHVTDLIAEGMLIVNWEALPAEVAAMMHPHPSLSEGIGEAHLALAGKPLHTP